MKRLLVLIVVLSLLAVGLFAGGKAEAKAQELKMTLGHGATAQHSLQDTSVKFASLINERTNGRVTIDVFPNRQLGEERAMVEGLQLGTVGLTIVSSGPVGGFVPEVGVLDLPFLFNTSEHAYRVLDGDIGQGILSKFEPKGMIGLSFMENGWRSLTANKRIRTPEDLRGLKVRTMENRVHMATFRAMGASPVPMVWGEVYTGLQSGIIDGQENPVAIVFTNSLWEVQRFYPQTKHFYTPYVFLMSKMVWDKLSSAEQRTFRQTAVEMTTFQRNLINQQLQDQVTQLRSRGMDVYDVDRAAFKTATKAVYAEFESVFGKDLINRIIAAGN